MNLFDVRFCKILSIGSLSQVPRCRKVIGIESTFEFVDSVLGVSTSILEEVSLSWRVPGDTGDGYLHGLDSRPLPRLKKLKLRGVSINVFFISNQLVDFRISTNSMGRLLPIPCYCRMKSSLSYGSSSLQIQAPTMMASTGSFLSVSPQMSTESFSFNCCSSESESSGMKLEIDSWACMQAFVASANVDGIRELRLTGVWDQWKGPTKFDLYALTGLTRLSIENLPSGTVNCSEGLTHLSLINTGMRVFSEERDIYSSLEQFIYYGVPNSDLEVWNVYAQDILMNEKVARRLKDVAIKSIMQKDVDLDMSFCCNLKNLSFTSCQWARVVPPPVTTVLQLFQVKDSSFQPSYEFRCRELNMRGVISKSQWICPDEVRKVVVYNWVQSKLIDELALFRQATQLDCHQMSIDVLTIPSTLERLKISKCHIKEIRTCVNPKLREVIFDYNLVIEDEGPSLDGVMMMNTIMKNCINLESITISGITSCHPLDLSCLKKLRMLSLRSCTLPEHTVEPALVTSSRTVEELAC
eukprot:GHVH01005400.1.p1 GENE.GHVH01005400.1~~GHVH01005400.1.p1  ORF type:complete len:525 (+),score=45.81 GHVH01005400.1:849-2423(+)